MFFNILFSSNLIQIIPHVSNIYYKPCDTNTLKTYNICINFSFKIWKNKHWLHFLQWHCDTKIGCTNEISQFDKDKHTYYVYSNLVS